MDRPSLYRALVFYLTPVLAISAAAWLVTRPVSTSAHETLEEKNARLWRAALGTTRTPMPYPTTIGPVRESSNIVVANAATAATATPAPLATAATPRADDNLLPQFISETGAFAPPPIMSPGFGAALNEPADSMFATMRRTEREVAPRFEAWKRAYSGPVDKFLAFYAPDAKVSLDPGKTLTSQEFAKTKRVLNRREAKLIVEGNSDGFGSGSSNGGMNDLQHSVPLFFGRVDGKQGVERVVQFEWQKRGGVWLIVNEQHGAPYTSRYALVPAEKPASRLKRALFSTATQDDTRFLERVARTRNTRERRALLKVYQRWQQTHFGPVEPYIELYAPNAQVHPGGQAVLSREALRSMATQVRTAKQFDLVSDELPPQIALDGNRAEVRARLRYEFSGDHTAMAGPRRLLWQKQNGKWRIVEDSYPSNFEMAAQSRFDAARAAALAKLPHLILKQPTARADEPQFLARAQKSPASKRELFQSFAAWQNTLSQPDEHYSAFYTANAQVVQSNNQPISRETQHDNDKSRSRDYMIETDEDGTPQIVVNNGVAELRVRRVLQTSRNSQERVSGDWRLFWRKQNGQWLITREEQPMSYEPISTPTPAATLGGRF